MHYTYTLFIGELPMTITRKAFDAGHHNVTIVAVDSNGLSEQRTVEYTLSDQRRRNASTYVCTTGLTFIYIRSHVVRGLIPASLPKGMKKKGKQKEHIAIV